MPDNALATSDSTWTSRRHNLNDLSMEIVSSRPPRGLSESAVMSNQFLDERLRNRLLAGIRVMKRVESRRQALGLSSESVCLKAPAISASPMSRPVMTLHPRPDTRSGLGSNETLSAANRHTIGGATLSPDRVPTGSLGSYYVPSPACSLHRRADGGGFKATILLYHVSQLDPVSVTSVEVRGTFSSAQGSPIAPWSEGIPLAKDPLGPSGKRWFVDVTNRVPAPGTYVFKFVLNGNIWRVSPRYQVHVDSSGNSNNALFVRSSHKPLQHVRSHSEELYSAQSGQTDAQSGQIKGQSVENSPATGPATESHAGPMSPAIVLVNDYNSLTMMNRAKEEERGEEKEKGLPTRLEIGLPLTDEESLRKALVTSLPDRSNGGLTGSVVSSDRPLKPMRGLRQSESDPGSPRGVSCEDPQTDLSLNGVLDQERVGVSARAGHPTMSHATGLYATQSTPTTIPVCDPYGMTAAPLSLMCPPLSLESPASAYSRGLVAPACSPASAYDRDEDTGGGSRNVTGTSKSTSSRNSGGVCGHLYGPLYPARSISHGECLHGESRTNDGRSRPGISGSGLSSLGPNTLASPALGIESPMGWTEPPIGWSPMHSEDSPFYSPFSRSYHQQSSSSAKLLKLRRRSKLGLVCGVHVAPHPDKALMGGADAFFCSTHSAGVADGVGEWEWRYRINPRQFAEELMDRCLESSKHRRRADSFHCSSPMLTPSPLVDGLSPLSGPAFGSDSTPAADPNKSTGINERGELDKGGDVSRNILPSQPAESLAKSILEEAHGNTASFGSSTAIVCSMDASKDDGVLSVASIGDSCLMVFRKRMGFARAPDRAGPSSLGSAHPSQQNASIRSLMSCVFRSAERQHSFNVPLQVSRLPNPSEYERLGSDPVYGTLVRDLQNFVGSKHSPPQNDDPSIADSYSVPVLEGDLIIIVSDGVTDNLWPSDLADIVSRAAQVTPFEARVGFAVPTDPEHIAISIANAAMEKSQLKTGYRSPFGSECRKKTGKIHPGGKPDDIVVVAAWVAAQEDVLRTLKILGKPYAPDGEYRFSNWWRYHVFNRAK